MKDNKQARILFFDIECTNLKSNFGYVLCIGYKFSDEKDAHIMSITDYKRHKTDVTDDSELLKDFRKVWEKADISVAHYGSKFDLPFLQTRYLMNGMQILPENSFIDTWRIAKYKLCLNSNRLDTLINTFECKHKKTPVDGNQWVIAIAGYKDAIKYVCEHCYYDVMSLEEVYNKIKPLMTNHPRISGPKEDINRVCPTCEGKLEKHGYRRTTTKMYQRMHCTDCGRCTKGELITA